MRYAIHNILQLTIACLLLTVNEGPDYLLYLLNTWWFFVLGFKITKWKP
jgi:hypothetical protein